MLLSLLLLLLHQETTAVTTVINNCFRYKGGRPTIGSATTAAVVLVGYCSVKHHHPIDHPHRLLLYASSVVDIRYINHKYWKLTHWRLFLPSLSMISIIMLFECWAQCMMIYRLCCIVISFNWMHVHDVAIMFWHFLSMMFLSMMMMITVESIIMFTINDYIVLHQSPSSSSWCSLETYR